MLLSYLKLIDGKRLCLSLKTDDPDIAKRHMRVLVAMLLADGRLPRNSGAAEVYGSEGTSRPRLDEGIGRGKGKRKNAAEAAPARTEEADLFHRGKAILGDSAGGLIKNLIKAKAGSIALARAAIETASTKQDPREYIAACIHGPEAAAQRANGWDPRL